MNKVDMFFFGSLAFMFLIAGLYELIFPHYKKKFYLAKYLQSTYCSIRISGLFNLLMAAAIVAVFLHLRW